MEVKYGVLDFNNNVLGSSGTILYNIGDYLQFLTIKFLLDRLGVSKEDICEISMPELLEYDGEELILPLNYSIFDEHFMKDGKFALPAKITPVFLACTLQTFGLNGEKLLEDKDNVAYLKRFEPIGCRDEYTKDVLTRFGILSYLTGCLTATLPLRTTNKAKKVFFVDAPYLLKKHIPSELLKDCEFMTQQYYFSSDYFSSPKKIFEFVKKQYERYAEEGALMVTSRLHVASPCMAMGIPVILAKDKIDYRFAWLDKYIPLYSYEEYDKIDWNPASIDYEAEKELLILVALKRLKDVHCTAGIEEVDRYYQERNRGKYENFYRVALENTYLLDEFAKRNWVGKEKVEYAFWGATSATEKIYRYICEKYPNAKLVKIIDTYQDVVFHGIRSEKPEVLTAEDSFDTIVNGVGASNAAYQLFHEIHKSEDKYCLMGNVFLSEQDRKA
ncbi:MAG: polysaccharide pyruvyl transferase family protein [Clostridia bacterium]|nr:polysaccharide pyruvyl transferase family protein [Clostridia bacterium]